MDDDAYVMPYSCTNHLSVKSGPAHDNVSHLILQGISDGKYVRADFVCKCMHALGAVPKTDNTFRPITDCHFPL